MQLLAQIKRTKDNNLTLVKKMKETIPDRIARVKRDKGLNNMDLAVLWETSEQTVKNYLRKEKPIRIPVESLELLSKKYQIDLGWLISGDTNTNKLHTLPEHNTQHSKRDVENIAPDIFDHSGINQLVGKGKTAPLIPGYYFDVMAAPIESFKNKTIVPSFQMSIPGFEDCDMNFFYPEQGMSPTLSPGCMVLSMSITDLTLIIPGEMYFIITTDYKIVRRLNKSKKREVYLAVADNIEGNYQDVEIPLSKIILLYLVKGAIQPFQV